MIELRQLSRNLGIQEYEMLQGIINGEYGFMNDAYGISYEEYKEWLIKQDCFHIGKNMPPKWIPYTTFFLYDNGIPIGYGRIRHSSNESNIFACYQDAYNNDRYEIVLIFCDTDKKPFREYKQVKKKINEFHDGRSASNKIVIFANPCIMQIILSHFGEVCLRNQGKKTNADVIEKLTGVKNYDAHEDQIKNICKKIFRRTYPEMKERISVINFKDNVPCSTNFIDFIIRFESDNLTWIKDINNYLQK